MMNKYDDTISASLLAEFILRSFDSVIFKTVSNNSYCQDHTSIFYALIERLSHVTLFIALSMNKI